MRAPEIQFARAGEVHIAYQVFGEGMPLVACGGPAAHLEILWEEPNVERFFERLASFARVAIFDRRGTGASDPADGPPDLEQYMDDLLAVMDACGFERAVINGGGAESGRMCALFAATYPERVSALSLFGTSATGASLATPDRLGRLAEIVDGEWGKGRIAEFYAPSMLDDERFMRWFARLERNAVSPKGALEIGALSMAADVTDALPRIQAPTLVMHRRDDTLVPVEEGRAVAAAIPNARFVEVEGRDNMGWVGDVDVILAELEEFLTGTVRHRDTTRALATVLFTDVVGSTDLAARLGDRRWRDLLADHDRLVDREIERSGGRVVKHVGDGVVATFELPGHALRAARAAIDATAGLGLRLRAGVHLGEIELVGDDIAGLAVHIGARIAALAGPAEVVVSRTVRDVLAGSAVRFEPRGTHELKGVPGSWPLYANAPEPTQSAAPREPGPTSADAPPASAPASEA